MLAFMNNIAINSFNYKCYLLHDISDCRMNKPNFQQLKKLNEKRDGRRRSKSLINELYKEIEHHLLLCY